MKSQRLMNGFLITVIAVLLFYIRISAEETPSAVKPEFSIIGGDCRYSEISGYAPYVSISSENARTYSGNYVSFANGRGDNIYGGIITKTALDSIFCTGAYNALAYRLAIDTEGRLFPKNSIFVIVGGVNMVEDGSGYKIQSQYGTYFAPDGWCPPDCLSF